MHYDEAVLLQQVRKLPMVTKRGLIDVFVKTFPYGAPLFRQTEAEYRAHVESNIQIILQWLTPHGIRIQEHANDD